MKKEKKKSLWSCTKEPGPPCKAQHHGYYSHKSNTLTIKLCPMYNKKKQDSQVQFDESPRSGNSINRLITKPPQLPHNTMP